MEIAELEQLLDEDAIRRLVELTEGRTDAVVSLVDVDLRMVWASELGARSMFGREQHDFAGEPATSYVHPEDLDEFVRAYQRAAEGDTVTWEGRALRADGVYQLVRSVIWPVRVPDQVAYVGITTPVE